ncbi:MAG: ABC transporter ATP-binding protein [Gammaproteobacteria bacterium]|nr:ABC transporter ATP-binding protein [Gammaproteobacteria bacterium]
MLEVSGLCVDYGDTRVVEGLGFALAEDEILTLVGPTACGKTTILHAIAGLVPIAAGEIRMGRWRAAPDSAIPPERRNVGMVFQDFALFPHLSVLENAGFRLRDKARAEHWLRLLGLADFRHARPATLSGGQKQRVALARTLAHEPGLVLLDEPLSNLDAALKDSLRREIRAALKKAGIPAIWVTHDQSEALSVGDRLGVLRRGKLEQLAEPECCFSRPANRFVAAFLGEASFLPGLADGTAVETSLGAIAAAAPASGEVDVLLRPGDLSLSHAVGAAEGGNGVIDDAIYEGATWLYRVTLDTGPMIQARVGHGNRLNPGSRVTVAVASRQPLAIFQAAGRESPDGTQG